MVRAVLFVRGSIELLIFDADVAGSQLKAAMCERGPVVHAAGPRETRLGAGISLSEVRRINRLAAWRRFGHTGDDVHESLLRVTTGSWVLRYYVRPCQSALVVFLRVRGGRARECV